MTIIPTCAPNFLTACAKTGVGSGRGKTLTFMPAPLKISALSRVKSSEPYLASRPITTESKLRCFMYCAIAVAVLPTTARFIPDGPGAIGPRNPAVPKVRKPLNNLSKVAASFLSSRSCNSAAVFGSGSSAIQLSISARSIALI